MLKNKPLTDTDLQNIMILWRHRVPTKDIAVALKLRYPTVSMYIRAFKMTRSQFTPEVVVNKILELTGQKGK